MKKILLGSVALMALGLTAPASAADLAARPYTKAHAPVIAPLYDWSGFYIGLNGGGGSSHICTDLTNQAGVGAIVPPVSEGCHSATGGTAGGQIGYRWQASQWVFGLEAQGNWADFNGNNSYPSLIGVPFTNHTKIDAFGLFTGQVGYAFNNALFYLKGGAAVAHDKYDTYVTATGAGVATGSETRWGGAVGAGLDYGFAPNWSVGLEYDHLFMGNRDVTFHGVGNFGIAAGAFAGTGRTRQDVDLGLVRVNYRWGGPVVAKY